MRMVSPPVSAPPLSEEQVERYSRQILLDEVGVEGQRRLLDSKVLIVGAGGLGAPAALYLAAAGVGTLGIVDGDRVELSNLHRQVIHYTHDIGRPKTQSARRTLEDINSDVRVVPHQTVLTSDNALEILRNYDLVINGCDNFPTRYLVNDACVLLGLPLVDASILRWEGQATVFLPGKGCYRCLFPSPPPPGSVPSCAEGGIIGALAGHMGTLQALEAVKLLLGAGEPATNKLILFDALAGEYTTVRWERDPQCPVCGDHPTITELIDYEAFCGLPGTGHRGGGVEVSGSPATQDPAGRTLTAAPAGVMPSSAGRRPASEAPPSSGTLPATDWLAPRQAWELLQSGAAELIDVREPWEWNRARVPGSRLIPMGEVPGRLKEIDPSRPAILLCASGQRSGRVTQALRKAGYPLAYNLKGGIIAWEGSGLPVERGG